MKNEATLKELFMLCVELNRDEFNIDFIMRTDIEEGCKLHIKCYVNTWDNLIQSRVERVNLIVPLAEEKWDTQLRAIKIIKDVSQNTQIKSSSNVTKLEHKK